MAISVKAVYEDGMLNPAQPLPLQEHEKVKATIEPDRNSVERTAGLIQWTGDHETLRRLAEDVEFDPQEDQ